MNDVFVVLFSHLPRFSGDSNILIVLSVSQLEETAWTSIESNINANLKNEFIDPCISIYPESKSVRVSVPIRYGCDGANVIYRHYDYDIIRKPIID